MTPPTSNLIELPPATRPSPRPLGGGRPPEPPEPSGGGDGPGRPDGRPPDLALFAMKWFVAGEVIMFGALVLVQCSIRWQQDEWPPAGQPSLPLISTGFNSLFLLASGWTFTRAQRVLQGGETRRGLGLLWGTSLLATTFLALQGWEWVRLLGYGLSARENLYGYLFYFIIGVHAAHVLVALAFLLTVTLRRQRSSAPPADFMDVAVCRLFWMFVVWVWPALYVTVYMP